AKQLFIKLTYYLFDQGFVSGASFAPISQETMRDFYAAFFLMKTPLHMENLKDDVLHAMKWFSNLTDAQRNTMQLSLNNDIFATPIIGHLINVLMQEDTPEKLTSMQIFLDRLNNGLIPSLSIDIENNRNRAVFNPYNNSLLAHNRLRELIETVYILAKTDFSIPEEPLSLLKKVLLNRRYYSNVSICSNLVSSQYLVTTECLDPRPFALLALLGTSDGTQDIDAELASAYLRLVGNSSDKFVKFFNKKNINPETVLTGNLALPHAGVMIQRRDNWGATVRKPTCNSWCQNVDSLNDYLAHSILQIESNNTILYGNKSSESLRNYPANQEQNANLSTMFSNMVTLGGKNGGYSIEFQEKDANQDLRKTRKSYFFFDNRVICLGTTNIETQRLDKPLLTKFFQETIPVNCAEVTINKKKIKKLPFEWRKNVSASIIDAQCNAYFVRNASVFLKKNRVATDSLITFRTNNDLVDCASITISPSYKGGGQNPSYEYAILIQPNNKDLKHWMDKAHKIKSPHYDVVVQDSQAHIVYDKTSKMTIYAFFDALKVKSKKVLVKEVSTSCMIMTHYKSKKEFVLSIAKLNASLNKNLVNAATCCDINFVNNTLKMQVTLQGKWELAMPLTYCHVLSSSKQLTVLEFTQQSNFSQEITLIKQ
ncbi:MAG: chondroitinase family polysaccharide lyase, partial [Bacteroidales bacterium]